MTFEYTRPSWEDVELKVKDMVPIVTKWGVLSDASRVAYRDQKPSMILLNHGVVLTLTLEVGPSLDIPLRVKFYNVPFEFWNPRGLGKIALKLGKQLYADQITNEYSRATYARILVEVDVRHKPIFDHKVKKPDKKYFTQEVSYENFSKYCYHCKIFKHGWESCNVLKKIDELKNSNGKQVEVEEGTEEGDDMPEPIAQVQSRKRKGKAKVVKPQVVTANGDGGSTSGHVHARGGPPKVAKRVVETMVSLVPPCPIIITTTQVQNEARNGMGMGTLRQNEEERGASDSSYGDDLSESLELSKENRNHAIDMVITCTSSEMIGHAMALYRKKQGGYTGKCD
ncbi:hypothetical protein LIER_43666 [Lithospermum erythrorhizon]|uniref:DUF4283 domain-containing protein n=1 Tax=Lithospermum erythrorhizon TaxID=34254 RepID=A0AAV3QLS3_LITER